MVIKFVAHVSGVDDEDGLVAGVAENEDGAGRTLLFQAAGEPPDVQLGMDTYCLVTEDQGTAYGCVRELTIDGARMTVVVGREHLSDLGLDDEVTDVELAVPPEAVEVLREFLAVLRLQPAGPAVLRPATPGMKRFPISIIFQVDN